MSAAMRVPKLAIIFLFVGCLVVYLTYVKQHFDDKRTATAKSTNHYHYQADRSKISAHVSEEHFRYGIMFDAGSTGTRVHIFQFQHDPKEAPKLAHETFEAIKPGLSAYADEPERSKAGVKNLLEVAKNAIPAPQWGSTPLVLRATAGLRLLPGEKATHLLNKVREVFDESPFLHRKDSVSIMDGTDEGVSAWITINFLLGGLHGSETSTVGMLDLGGGSTQITFSPQDEKTVQTSPIDYITSFQMFNSSHTLYSHSYLGLGLMSARLAVLGGVEGQPLAGTQELVSPCLAPDYTDQWEHAEVKYIHHVQLKERRKAVPILQEGITPLPQTLRAGRGLSRVRPGGVFQPFRKQFVVLPKQQELTQHYKRFVKSLFLQFFPQNLSYSRQGSHRFISHGLGNKIPVLSRGRRHLFKIESLKGPSNDSVPTCA